MKKLVFLPFIKKKLLNIKWVYSWEDMDDEYSRSPFIFEDIFFLYINKTSISTVHS